MAVNDSRSMNVDLKIGARDGTFKSLTPDRGGEVDPTHATYRQQAVTSSYPSGDIYGIKERSPLADMADGTFHQ